MEFRGGMKLHLTIFAVDSESSFLHLYYVIAAFPAKTHIVCKLLIVLLQVRGKYGD